ncbi:caspase-1-like isoform X1 [Ostrinia nubilalis]|uniref:caspase-1-like isoform X1 n=1 Tax=Ostrinia nubilalis TaxID=29057 RepID=UPI0030824A8C
MDLTQSDARTFQSATNLLPEKSNLPPSASRSVPLPDSSIKFDPDGLYYDMSGKKEILIFNHSEYEANEFYGKKPPDERTDHLADYERLEKVFSFFGFKPFYYENKTYDVIKRTIKAKAEEDHSKTSCLAVAIMTHGLQRGILCAYDTTYYLAEMVWLLENGHSSLVHKPKLFFIQACRGWKVDPGKMTHCDGPNSTVLHVPRHVDFFIGRSTVEDYRAWKYIEGGSWYIRELCQIFMKHYNHLDLDQMMTLVTRRVAYDHKSKTLNAPELTGMKETPEKTSTLTKLLKFSHCKPYDD